VRFITSRTGRNPSPNYHQSPLDAGCNRADEVTTSTTGIHMTDMIETMRNAGKKAGVAEARRILMAYLSGQNTEALVQIAKKLPEARAEVDAHIDAEDGGRATREWWLAYLNEIEPAVTLTQSAAR
jgi:hypothetical protein